MNTNLFAIYAGAALVLTLAIGCGISEQDTSIATSDATEFSPSYEDNYQIAKSWQPIWVVPSSDLNVEFHVLLEKGFVMQVEAKPGSSEEKVFNSIIGLTEPTEVVLVSVVGDKFVALAAGVIDRESNEESGTPITVPLFGGQFFFNNGFVNQSFDTAPSARKVSPGAESPDNKTMHRSR
ncbi:MAG: hypothetical protein ACKVHR_20060 [Pirellulales bacterium]